VRCYRSTGKVTAAMVPTARGEAEGLGFGPPVCGAFLFLYFLKLFFTEIYFRFHDLQIYTPTAVLRA